MIAFLYQRSLIAGAGRVTLALRAPTRAARAPRARATRSTSCSAGDGSWALFHLRGKLKQGQCRSRGSRLTSRETAGFRGRFGVPDRNRPRPTARRSVSGRKGLPGHAALPEASQSSRWAVRRDDHAGFTASRRRTRRWAAGTSVAPLVVERTKREATMSAVYTLEQILSAQNGLSESSRAFCEALLTYGEVLAVRLSYFP